ncbi:DUF4436 domain-containing protein [Rhodococcus hoagii]|nr:DUF4436 domain-containing protein [Prescottella equi]
MTPTPTRCSSSSRSPSPSQHVAVDVESRVAPGASFLDSAEPISRAEMTVLVSPSIARTKLVLPQGRRDDVRHPGAARRAGRRWPFDRFVVDPLVVTALHRIRIGRAGPSHRVLVDGEARGLDRRRRRALGDGQDVQEVRVEVHRSGGILVYSALLLALMVILAALAGVRVDPDRAPPPRRAHRHAGWMAAMSSRDPDAQHPARRAADRRLGRHHRHGMGDRDPRVSLALYVY